MPLRERPITTVTAPTRDEADGRQGRFGLARTAQYPPILQALRMLARTTYASIDIISCPKRTTYGFKNITSRDGSAGWWAHQDSNLEPRDYELVPKGACLGKTRVHHRRLRKSKVVERQYFSVSRRKRLKLMPVPPLY